MSNISLGSLVTGGFTVRFGCIAKGRRVQGEREGLSSNWADDSLEMGLRLSPMLSGLVVSKFRGLVSRMGDKPFEPRLGHLRSVKSGHQRSYLDSVMRVAGRNRMPRYDGMRPFVGTRLGRGAVAARAISLRGAISQARRTIVRVQMVRVGRVGRLMAHLSYLRRDGVARDGGHGRLYSALEDGPDARAFAERCVGDRHQFRFFAAVEDAAEYEDLSPLIRRLMSRMEKDLGTHLDWVAVNHLDTLYPHSHVVLRGIDEDGGDLIISPNYITRGICVRMAELVNLDLGPRTELESNRCLRLDVDAERLTTIDLKLLREVDADRIVSPSASKMFDQAIRTGRLRKLESLGLAEGLSHGRWRLSDELETTLREVSKRADRFQVMKRALAAAGVDRMAFEQTIFDWASDKSLVGRLIAHGFVDEIATRKFLIIDSVDGHTHYADVGVATDLARLVPGSIIRLSREHKLELLSLRALEQLPRLEGATWLDRILASEEREPLRDAGFGREVRSALALRRTWLIEHGLASEKGETLLLPENLLAELRHRELWVTAAQIRAENDKDFIEPQVGGRIEGIVRRSMDLVSGVFALIEDERTFALVPWEPSLERAIGREVSGLVGKDASISWTLARERGMEL